MIEETSKKKRVKIIIGILILIVIIGVSYAYMRITRTQEEENLVDTLKCLDITLTSETDSVNLVNAIAISNEIGMKHNPYTFTVSNKCSTTVIAQVLLEVLETTTLSHQYVRASLNDTGDTTDNSKVLTGYTLGEATIEDATSYILLSETELTSYESKTYDLRLWVDDNTPIEAG